MRWDKLHCHKFGKVEARIIALLAVCTALMLSAALSGATQPNLECTDCHNCPKPTTQSPCLKVCPTLMASHQGSPHEMTEAPDSMLIKELTELFQPVRFDHKLHAGMAQMGSNCATCHHFSPEGPIPPCKNCHGGETNPNNLRQPSLKGAYHRLCLCCHREWDHSTRCVMCHAPIPGKASATEGMDTTDIIGVPHPIMTEPVKNVYNTPYAKGPIVTFKHKEHIELFGLKCANCHQKENCTYCHAEEKPASLVKTDAEIHSICTGCHRNDDCKLCHDKKERRPFSHASTGWALNGYHQKLDCRACHPTGKRISRLDNNCAACHGGWNQENFRHTVTGLELDETHHQAECSDCHVGRNYAAKPDCSGCHDDGRSPKTAPPGRYIKQR